MATKTITIMEKAYEALLKEKMNKESFTEVILRLANNRGLLMECFGTWDMKEDEWKKIRKELDKNWKDFDERLLEGH